MMAQVASELMVCGLLAVPYMISDPEAFQVLSLFHTRSLETPANHTIIFLTPLPKERIWNSTEIPIRQGGKP